MDFTYKSGNELRPEGAFTISPSGLNEFFECSATWYAKKVEHTGAFGGNTASVTGDVVHASAEVIAKGGDIDHLEIDQYIHLKELADPENISGFTIRKNYNEMVDVIRNYFDEYGLPDRVEEYIQIDLGDGVWVAGSADAVQGTTLVDYKTVAAIRSQVDYQNPKSKDDNILNYRMQLYTYAWIYTKLGVPINKIRAVYITVPKRDRGLGKPSKTGKPGKPLKEYPSELKVVEEPFTKKHFDWIEAQLQTIKLTYLLGKANPEFLPLLFRDNIRSWSHIPVDDTVGLAIEGFEY